MQLYGENSHRGNPRFSDPQDSCVPLIKRLYPLKNDAQPSALLL